MKEYVLVIQALAYLILAVERLGRLNHDLADELSNRYVGKIYRLLVNHEITDNGLSKDEAVQEIDYQLAMLTLNKRLGENAYD